MTKAERIRNTTSELRKREMKNLGRWCEVTLKRTGEKILVVRTGYGPMERPEGDPHEISINDETIARFDTLHGVAAWMCSR